MLGRRDRIRVECLDWTKDTRPLFAADRQESINAQIGPYEIFVGIFGERIGTRTGRAESGTVEEYEQAVAEFAEHGRPVPMLYFRKSQIDRPNRDELEQLSRLVAFEERVRPFGHTRDYDDARQFGLMFLEHLAGTIDDEFRPSIAADRAAAESPPAEQGADAEADEPAAATEGDLLGLRLALEAKLAWVCKHLLGGPQTATFATIGSLRYDGYLSEDQAFTLARVMAGRPPAAQSGEVRERFLDDATRTVSGFRAIVFDAFVRKHLTAAGWAIEDFEQRGGHRPDFLAVKDGRAFRVAPRVITGRTSDMRRRTARRLGEASDEPRPVAGRIIVMPDATYAEPDARGANPRAVRVAGLLDALS